MPELNHIKIRNTVYDVFDKTNVTDVVYSNKKLTKTIDRETTEIVSAATLKNDMNLSNVDNTSDLNKPISTATQTALNGKLATGLKGAANGLAELDGNGKVPASQLPSYVDDVIEGYYYNNKFYSDSAHTHEITGESGKIYVDLTSGSRKVYRWSGSAFAEIPIGLALGTTSSTAYRGDYGQAAYTHGVTNKGSAFASGLYKITTNSEGHVIAVVAVSKSDITALGIPAQDTTYVFNGTYDAVNNKVATEDTVKNAIAGLDGNLNGTTPGSGKTLTAFSETDGKVNATFAPISITKSQVSDFPTLGSAAAKGVTDNTSQEPVTSTDDNLITGRTLYNAGYTKNTGTVTQVTAGVGLVGGNITESGTIKVKLKTETAAQNESATPTDVVGRQYPVTQDPSGYLSVNVPWSPSGAVINDNNPTLAWGQQSTVGDIDGVALHVTMPSSCTWGDLCHQSAE